MDIDTSGFLVSFLAFRSGFWAAFSALALGEDGCDDGHDDGRLDIADRAVLESQVAAFWQDHGASIVGSGHDARDAGFDLFCTRERHGTGFWEWSSDNPDFDGLGDTLTQAAHAQGEIEAYIGDDGKVHTMAYIKVKLAREAQGTPVLSPAAGALVAAACADGPAYTMAERLGPAEVQRNLDELRAQGLIKGP